MNNINYGGSAFPISSPDGLIHEDGMSMRDFFAAKAMQSLILKEVKTISNNEVLVITKTAYLFADKMIENSTKK